MGPRTSDLHGQSLKETPMTSFLAQPECKRHGPQSDGAKFCSQCGASLIANGDITAPGTSERRVLSILFCDIVGSTGHLQRIGMEDWAKVLDDFQKTIRAVVSQYGGSPKQDLGDGLLAYFGWPTAHDDDAKRAVHAALAILPALSEVNARSFCHNWPELTVRVAVSTGRTLIGPNENGTESLARGEAPHVAARLQTLAESNTVLIDDTTNRLVRGFFRCRNVEDKRLKDFPDVAPFMVLEATSATTRLDTWAPADLTPFVGRTAELKALAKTLDEVRHLGRRTVLVQADPGVGKTRLVSVFKAELDTPDFVFECRASPYHQNRALFPIVDMLERTLDIAPSDSSDRKLGKIERWLSGSAALGTHLLEAFAPLFSVELDPGHPAVVGLSAQKQRQIVFESLEKWLDFLGSTNVESKRRTVLLVLEDAHWADPSTLEFVGNVAKSRALSNLFVIVTARPEFRNPWPDVCAELALDRLSDSDTEQIVLSFVPDRSVPPDLLQFVLRKADGVPLFAEELAKTLIETGIFANDLVDTPRELFKPSQFEVPFPLIGILMARLDRLGRVKQTAQLAASLGREFRLDILRAVSSTAADTLQTDLLQLRQVGLIHPTSADTYAFKHALIRDAAYEASSSQSRKSIHARIASTIEKQFPELATTQPDVLAFHYSAANQKGQAVGFAQRAAEQALQRSAFAEARAHASNALAWADSLDDVRRPEAELAVNGVMSQVMMNTLGWGDPQVEAIAKRSTALLQKVGQGSPHRIPMLWSLFTYYHTVSNRAAALDVAKQLVDLADASRDAGQRSAALTVRAIVTHPAGDLRGARLDLERALDLYDRQLHREQGKQMGMDSSVLASTLLAQILWWNGETSSAFELTTNAIEWGRKIGHVPSIAIGLLYACQVHQLAGDRPNAAAMAEEVLSLSAKYGLPAFEGYAAIMQAWSNRDDQKASAILQILTSMGCKVGLTYWSSLGADNLAEAGRFSEAVNQIDHCLSLCREIGEHYYEPELHRRRALYEMQNRGSASDDTQRSLEEAARLARQQHAPRTEALALRELVTWFGGSPTTLARLEELSMKYPGLRKIELEATTTQGEANGHS